MLIKGREPISPRGGPGQDDKNRGGNDFSYGIGEGGIRRKNPKDYEPISIPLSGINKDSQKPIIIPFDSIDTKGYEQSEWITEDIDKDQFKTDDTNSHDPLNLPPTTNQEEELSKDPIDNINNNPPIEKTDIPNIQEIIDSLEKELEKTKRT